MEFEQILEEQKSDSEEVGHLLNMVSLNLTDKLSNQRRILKENPDNLPFCLGLGNKFFITKQSIVKIKLGIKYTKLEQQIEVVHEEEFKPKTRSEKYEEEREDMFGNLDSAVESERDTLRKTNASRQATRRITDLYS